MFVEVKEGNGVKVEESLGNRGKIGKQPTISRGTPAQMRCTCAKTNTKEPTTKWAMIGVLGHCSQ